MRLYPIPHSFLSGPPRSFLGAAAAPAPPGNLRRAGLTTATFVDSKTVLLIQAALEQSRALGQFIPARSRPISVARNFVIHGSDAEFNGRYIKLNKIVVPFGSKEEKDLLNIRGFYHRPTDSIHLRPQSSVGLALRLAINKLSSAGFQAFFGKSIDEGLSLYYANQVLAEQGLAQMDPDEYRSQLRCARNLIEVAGPQLVGKAYFDNHVDLLRMLTTALRIGPVSARELTNDALCTARFDKEELFRTRCRKFFKEYELAFNPGDVKFGVDNNPKLTGADKIQRKTDVLEMVRILRIRLRDRAAAALGGTIPTFPPLPPAAVSIARTLADLQFNLFREWFPVPVGASVMFVLVQECFEQFANGELRDPTEVDHPGLYEPDSAAYFLFAEFAFLCREVRLNEFFWLQLLRTFVKTQEIFMHVYRENPKSPPPPVNAPLRARSTPRGLDAFKFEKFKQIGSSMTRGEGQSDLARKIALRAKYDRMDDAQLQGAARDNLRRAQLME
jgi:hypothetical protein